MDKINDGGPAFPREDYQTDFAPGQIGMSLRDYFAARAMQGLLTGLYSETSKYNLSDMPAEAYDIADAMLRAREAK